MGLPSARTHAAYQVQWGRTGDTRPQDWHQEQPKGVCLIALGPEGKVEQARQNIGGLLLGGPTSRADVSELQPGPRCLVVPRFYRQLATREEKGATNHSIQSPTEVSGSMNQGADHVTRYTGMAASPCLNSGGNGTHQEWPEGLLGQRHEAAIHEFVQTASGPNRPEPVGPTPV